MDEKLKRHIEGIEDELRELKERQDFIIAKIKQLDSNNNNKELYMNRKIYNGIIGGYRIICEELNKEFEIKDFGIRGYNIPCVIIFEDNEYSILKGLTKKVKIYEVKESFELPENFELPEYFESWEKYHEHFKKAAKKLSMIEMEILHHSLNEKQYAQLKLQYIADQLNNGWEPDWNNENELKCNIYYDALYEKWSVDCWYKDNYLIACFKSKELAQKAIEIMDKDLEYLRG